MVVYSLFFIIRGEKTDFGEIKELKNSLFMFIYLWDIFGNLQEDFFMFFIFLFSPVIKGKFKLVRFIGRISRYR